MGERLLTIQQAADFLQVTPRTIVRYGREGRIVIVGTGNGQRVNPASLYAYARGDSAWHANQQQPTNPPAAAHAGQQGASLAHRRGGREYYRPPIAALLDQHRARL